MTAGSPVSPKQNYQWRTETTRTTTAPSGETWRTETIRTNQHPQTQSASWRTDIDRGNSGITTGTTSWRSEKRTTTTTEVKSLPVEKHSFASDFRSNSDNTHLIQNQLMAARSPSPLSESRQYQIPQKQYNAHILTQQWRSESRQGEKVNPVDQRLVQLTRPESRQSNATSEHGSVANDLMHALINDVEQTTEIIKKNQHQMKMERRQFQTEMEVNGRISVEPQVDWLDGRFKQVSTEDLKQDLNRIKDDQRNSAVTNTLAALVYDVNATAEVLRRAQTKDKNRGKKEVKEEVEYKLRLTPSLDDESHPFPSPKLKEYGAEDKMTLEQMNRDYGVEISESQTASLRRRAHSETPRRTLQIESSPPPSSIPICAYCSEEIDGQILTALAPNSERAQKFHTYHFMCSYCQKALNMHGTYREHEKKPYCHDCFYKLYNGLLYCPDEHQAQIQKLI